MNTTFDNEPTEPQPIKAPAFARRGRADLGGYLLDMQWRYVCTLPTRLVHLVEHDAENNESWFHWGNEVYRFTDDPDNIEPSHEFTTEV